MERRAFFKLAGLSATALTAGGMLCACSSVERISSTLAPVPGSDAEARTDTVVAQPPVSFSSSVDVLVVGSGVSGLSAAMAPSEAGFKVMVVDKLSLLGGESYDADGIMHVAGSKIQKKAGLAQSAEDAWSTRKKELSSAGVGDLDFARSLYLEASRWVDRLADGYKAQFADPSTYVKEGLNDAIMLPKNGLGDMEGVMVPLRDGLASKGVVFQTGYRAVAFILDEDAAVCGMRFFVEESGSVVDVRAGAVVIATGGFASSQPLVSAHASALMRVGCYTHASMGEGQELCRRAGGQLSGMDGSMPLTSDLPQVAAWGMFAPTLIVDARGHRFAREDDMNASADACFSQDRGYWWTVFDKRISDGSQSRSAAQVTSKNAKRLIGPCSDAAELAAAMGVSADVLQATMDRYDKMVDAGKDDDFGRVANLKSLQAPYYAIKQLPVRYRTRGGAVTDENGRLTGTSGSAIRNVYCCGSVAANGGEGLASNGAFGMLVGEAVASALDAQA